MPRRGDRRSNVHLDASLDEQYRTSYRNTNHSQTSNQQFSPSRQTRRRRITSTDERRTRHRGRRGRRRRCSRHDRQSSIRTGAEILCSLISLLSDGWEGRRTIIVIDCALPLRIVIGRRRPCTSSACPSLRSQPIRQSKEEWRTSHRSGSPSGRDRDHDTTSHSSR